MTKCDFCGTKFNKENSPDGVNGYSVRIRSKDGNYKEEKEACKKCFPKEVKKQLPKK